LACTSTLISPISSRKSVPRSARPNRPLRASAPVYAPRTAPNSSLSASVFGIAAQLTGTNGPSRPLCSWIAAATSSLPTPVWPRINVGALLGADRIASRTRAIA
jgi:hypothetical protein